ncbi:phytoene desaturase family protein [Luteibaculum oceani]|uniref:Phytoene desaturase n=1 Tax=Luteibaculum oceani TaxID=1294296 RepID=A0A5C6VNU2_9FLAO|nr:phytoene desaturase family protein [Luteibaculum oceani]TXC85345.1 phytoene desaturase [Luteibaculum oceani]
MERKKIIVIGAGFSGLSAASFLAKAGYDVEVYEKHAQLGGRARKMQLNGFTFDMGPSWYWMPDVFEHFFRAFGKTPADFYNLIRLDPSYRVYFEDQSFWDIPAGAEKLGNLLDQYEKGASKQLKHFLEDAQKKYQIGMSDMVYKPGLSVMEFISWEVVKNGLKMDLFSSFSKLVRKYFSHPKIIELLEFPVLFLGAKPENTPALYSLMNYADIALGTWYPEGGMHKIVEAMVSVAESQGVKFITGANVKEIVVEENRAVGIALEGGLVHKADAVVAAADYHHVEQNLLQPKFRNYNQEYWESRTMAPSSLLFYVGLDREIPDLQHHNLFFDAPFNQHAKEIYDNPAWPENPLFYLSATSKTDKAVAPEGGENLFFLIPLAPGLQGDDETMREAYFNILVNRLEAHTGINIKDHVTAFKSYAVKDFKEDYNAFKGNAYGLANTLKQTAILKPKMINKKLDNLFYCGQLSVPGPGVPPSLISGEIIAGIVNEKLNEYETALR